MRDLFRFLQRARNTLLFLVLMVLAMSMLVRGNEHQRAQAISSSNAVVGTLYSWQNGITSYARLGEVNKELAGRNADLMNRHRSAYAPAENRFVVINDTVHEQRYRYVAAQVIGATHQKAKNYLTLDKGKKARVAEGMGVMGERGIVGVVRESSERFASVISVLNPDFSVSGQLRRTGHYGPITWDTRDPRTVSLMEIAKHVPVSVGDTVVTWSADGVFPRGIPIGTVASWEDDPGSAYHRITVTLSEDLTRSAMVYVVEDLVRSERDTLQAHEPPEDQ